MIEVEAKSIAVLRTMLYARFVDEKMFKLSRQNKGGAFHLFTGGHEMVGAVAASKLIPYKDWGLAYYRDRAFALGIGCTPKELFGAFLARQGEHHSGGRMMPEHFSHKELRLPCQSSCVGSQFLQAVGVAKGIQLQGKDEIVYVSAGEGATSQGDFHEALNFAALHTLPILFVIQDNGWAISVPVSEQTAGGSITSMAKGYEGLCVYAVDGGCHLELDKAFTEASERARTGLGPSLIVAKVPRLGPHSSSDDPQKYKESALIEQEKLLDPLSRHTKYLLQEGLITSEELKAMEEEIFASVETAAQEADLLPHPDPQTAELHLFAPSEEIFETETACCPLEEKIVMMDAINHAIDEEMSQDPGIIVFGQDVARGKGGVFGITKHLTAKHGPDRCFNTPLAESTIIGMALGMSLVPGLKPIAEIQFADYMWTGVNQLFNELASLHYRSDGEWRCPVVIRMPYGGYIQGGPYHSQSIEAFLSHAPGLKVVIPSNARDAKRLLKTAIHDPNPVIFLEHKALYRQRVFCARQEPKSHERLPFGKAAIVCEGSDVTIVCWGMMVVMAHEVALQLAKEGISIEVIDLRTLVPLDMATILQSIKKTGKLLIAHEAPKTCGFGAEIMARTIEEGFCFLDAPIMRVTGKDRPVPYAKGLEEAILPQAADIEKAVTALLRF